MAPEPVSHRSAPRGRAIITYSRSWQALAAIRSLGHRDVEVVAGDEYAVTPGALSRYTVERFEYPSSVTEPEAFLDALEDVVKSHVPAGGAPYVLMPIHQETSVIAKHRERFEPHILMALAKPEQFEQVEHKARLVHYAREHGIRIPPTWLPQTRRIHADELPAELSYPLFVKVARAASGVGVEKVEDAAQLERAYAEIVDRYDLRGEDLPLIQNAVSGSDYCVTTLFDQGRMQTCLIYRNVMTFPRGHGPGAVRETVSAKKLERLADELLSGIGWHGIAQVDFRWSGRDEDEAYLLEVNPRFFGGLFQAIESGVDYPWLLYQLAVEGHVEPPQDIVIGTRTETPVLSMLATISEIAESDTHTEQLETAWEDAKDAYERGEVWHAVRSVLEGLRDSLDFEGRMEITRELLEENAENVSNLLDADDPMPVLGLVYPLAMFLRHGKVTPELMMSTEGSKRH